MKTTTMLFMLLCSIFISCTKQGPVGPAGAPGNANVITTTFTTANTNWTANTNTNTQNTLWNYSAITQAVIDKGTVQVFNGNNTGIWLAMPFSYKGSELNFAVTVGQILITLTNNDGSLPPNPGGQQFKIVVIPGI